MLIKHDDVHEGNHICW